MIVYNNRLNALFNTTRRLIIGLRSPKAMIGKNFARQIPLRNPAAKLQLKGPRLWVAMKSLSN